MTKVVSNSIISAKTINSWYANESIVVTTENSTFRMKVSELLKLFAMHRTEFNQVKKNKYVYLEVDMKSESELNEECDSCKHADPIKYSKEFADICSSCTRNSKFEPKIK